MAKWKDCLRPESEAAKILTFQNSASQTVFSCRDPKKCKPSALLKFCLSNGLDIYGCVSLSDLSVVVNRAQLKQKNKDRRNAAEAAEKQRAVEGKKPKGLVDWFVSWIRGKMRGLKCREVKISLLVWLFLCSIYRHIVNHAQLHRSVISQVLA
ncbi:uncharacterized protein LOC132198842 [Neocloeon triangulifer]|uniref:uncharacterized protein LOC132198842 n=1 Tax=Neocloeon triangulifer TaxID=2078957 RepID=UPI00286F6F3D|nr:uncharacterized protein LOC132198842 [Neocloeon triangulifer]